MGKTLIIAEAGVNHNGSLEKALEMVKVAADAKADIVKFQTFKASKLATQSAPKAEYQKRNLENAEGSQVDMLKALELSYEHHHILQKECQRLGIGFLSTAFDFESLEFLISLNMGLWKIPSGEITNLPYLEKIGRLNQKTIISTGMADQSEVSAAIEVLTQAGLSKDKLVVLHCNTDYPTKMDDVHLNAMVQMGHTFKVVYGYSDHTMGIEVPIAAVALGAAVIEKHFTLDRTMAGPDHKASLEPNELKQMVKSIRNIEQTLGRSEKLPTESEVKNRVIVRKSIVANKRIQKGDRLTTDNITTARPGGGMSPMLWNSVLGTVAEQDYEEGDLIKSP